jgi:hypothetical protein
MSGVFTGGCSAAANPYPDVNSFCEARASAECQSPQSTSGGIASACGVAPSDCIDARQQTCISNAAMFVATGTRAYTSSAAPACIAAVQAAYAGSSIPYTAAAPAFSIQSLSVTCDEGVFPGTVPLQGVCATNDDCAQGSTPSADPNIPAVVCSPVQFGLKKLECANSVSVATNGECANFGSVCTDPGTVCKGAPAMCEPGGTPGGTGTQGSACTTNANCGPSFPYCDTNIQPNAACEVGLSFAIGADDCRSFGLSSGS